MAQHDTVNCSIFKWGMQRWEMTFEGDSGGIAESSVGEIIPCSMSPRTILIGISHWVTETLNCKIREATCKRWVCLADPEAHPKHTVRWGLSGTCVWRVSITAGPSDDGTSSSDMLADTCMQQGTPCLGVSHCLGVGSSAWPLALHCVYKVTLPVVTAE